MEKDRFDVIYDFLVANGASVFAGVLNNTPILFNARDRYTMILAPTDEALKRLEQATGKSIKELSTSIAGVNILANHVSVLPTQQVYPMFQALSGTKYGSNINDFAALGVIAKPIIGGVKVLIISQIIVHGNQVQLAQAKAGKNSGVFGLVKYQNFLQLVELGQLEGKDLVSFCLSNPDINNMCNKVDSDGMNIFEKLIKNKYGKTVPPGMSAREYYIDLFSGYDLYTAEFSEDLNVDIREVGFTDTKVNQVASNQYRTYADEVFAIGDNGDTIVIKGKSSLATMFYGDKVISTTYYRRGTDFDFKALKIINYTGSPHVLGSDGNIYYIRNDEISKATSVDNILDIHSSANSYFILNKDGLFFQTMGNTSFVYYFLILYTLTEADRGDFTLLKSEKVGKYIMLNKNLDIKYVISDWGAIIYLTYDGNNTVINIPRYVRDTDSVLTMRKVIPNELLTDKNVTIHTTPTGDLLIFIIKNNVLLEYYYGTRLGPRIYGPLKLNMSKLMVPNQVNIKAKEIVGIFNANPLYPSASNAYVEIVILDPDGILQLIEFLPGTGAIINIKNYNNIIGVGRIAHIKPGIRNKIFLFVST